jgi:hypothetical protein
MINSVLDIKFLKNGDIIPVMVNKGKIINKGLITIPIKQYIILSITVKSSINRNPNKITNKTTFMIE